jgi:Transposase.
MTSTKRFSPEVRERAVRLVFDQETEHSSQWACIEAIAPKIGCTPQTLRTWVKQAEVDQGRVDGVTANDRERMKALERENRELKRANEILRKASAYFAQAELDRRPK